MDSSPRSASATLSYHCRRGGPGGVADSNRIGPCSVDCGHKHGPVRTSEMGGVHLVLCGRGGSLRGTTRYWPASWGLRLWWFGAPRRPSSLAQLAWLILRDTSPRSSQHRTSGDRACIKAKATLERSSDVAVCTLRLGTRRHHDARTTCTCARTRQRYLSGKRTAFGPRFCGV